MKSKVKSRGLWVGTGTARGLHDSDNTDTYHLIVKRWKFKNSLKALELYVKRCVCEE